MRTDGPAWAPPVLAVQFLTRVPVGSTAALSDAQVRDGLVRAVAWFPLVGAFVGGVTASVAIGCTALWPPAVAIVIALIVEALLTGAFHEDAVADFCDGFGGGRTGDDVRRIMKDSRIGTYGALALLLATGLRAALMIDLVASRGPWVAASVIVAAATFGRWLIVAVMAAVRPVPGGTGLANDVGEGVGIGRLALATFAAIPGVFAFACHASLALVMASATGFVFVVWFRRLLLRRIGGSTGDCLGFAAAVGQLLLLLAAVAA